MSYVILNGSGSRSQERRLKDISLKASISVLRTFSNGNGLVISVCMQQGLNFTLKRRQETGLTIKPSYGTLLWYRLLGGVRYVSLSHGFVG